MEKIKLILLITGCVSMYGCVAVPGALMSSYKIYSTASTFKSIKDLTTDRRTIGEIIDNKISTIKVSETINDVAGSRNDLDFALYDRKLLVTGTINNLEKKEELIAELRKINGVHDVEESVIIGNPISITLKGIDIAITGLARARTSGLVEGTELEIHTNRKIVYLMGRLTKPELKNVLEKIINIAGVLTIKYYIINENNPSETITHKDYISYQYIGEEAIL